MISLTITRDAGSALTVLPALNPANAPVLSHES